VDVDNHIEHGVRPALTRDDARHMMSLSNGLRKIVTTHRIWTASQSLLDMIFMIYFDSGFIENARRHQTFFKGTSCAVVD